MFSTSWSSQITTHGDSRPRRLQVGVPEVLRVARAVVVDRLHLAALDAAHDLAADRAAAVLVDEVAEEQHEVGRPFGDVAMGGVEAGLEVLARRRGDAQLGRVGRRRRHPARRADEVAAAEAVPRRPGELGDDVHAVAFGGQCRRPSPVAEMLVERLGRRTAPTSP